MTCTFTGHPALYRYWDATRCCEFMAQATEQTIEQHLKQESLFLQRYDAICRQVDQQFDVANADLAKLFTFCLDQKGTLSQHRRKQYQHRVPAEVFDAIEQAYRDVTGADNE